MSDLTINAKVADLEDTLNANRQKHADEYATAKAGYIEAMWTKVNGWLNVLASGELLEGRTYLDPPPEDHTSDYDEVIAMLGWSDDDTIKLTQSQFRQYVQDEWGWKQQWTASNSSYMS